jgi:aspartate aminotransferase
MQGLFTSGANSISQMAGIAALEGDQQPVEEMKNAFLGRRNRILELLQTIPGLKYDVPEGAFYVFPDVSHYLGKSVGIEKIDTAEKLCFYLLNEAGVACVSGTAFGMPECIRISYATDIATIEKAVARLKDAFSKII